MPFAVAAPAAVIGALGALWYLITVLFGFDASAPGRFVSGALFGVGVFAVLAISANAPVRRITPPGWRGSVLLGLWCAVSLWLVSAPALGPVAAVLVAVLGGLSCLAADRRTTAGPTARNLHRAVLVVIMLVALERVLTALFIVDDPYSGLGILCAVLVAAFLPLERFQRWSLRLLPASRHRAIERPGELTGYLDEVLALVSFMEPQDIPRALVLAAAHEAGAGRASSLRSLSAVAIGESGPDALRADPLAQQFARQRMLGDERKAWAARTVRMLAESFPQDYQDSGTWAWCERLTPHAVTAAKHAEQLGVARGATALLLDQVAGYLVESGRLDQARKVASSAVAHAVAGFGEASAEVAILHAHKTQIEQPSADHGNGSGSDREPLAHHYALLGDARRESGDFPGARRDYLTALAHARAGLGGGHPLVSDLRARIGALPPEAKTESDERRLLIGCFSLLAALVAIISVGYFVFWRGNDGRMRASEEPLIRVEQLVRMCSDKPRYFPDAAPFGATVDTRPLRIFRRTNSDETFKPETYGVVSGVPANATQIVACVAQIRTGPGIEPCKYSDRPEIPLHEATYLMTAYEVRTGVELGTQTISATMGVCPLTYEPPGDDEPWMLYAGPSDEQYKQALIAIEDMLTTRVPAPDPSAATV